MSQQRTWTRADLPEALERALGAAIDRGAKAPVVLRLTEVAGYTDWALLLSARSERQVRGVVDGIVEALASPRVSSTEATTEAAGSDATGGEAPKPPPLARLIGSDGLDLYLWALLDYDDFLIHVFYHPVRRHYDLESMWRDAPRVELELPAEVMDDSDLGDLAPPDPMPSYRGDMTFGGFDDEFVDDEHYGDSNGDDDVDPEFVDDDEFDDNPPPSQPGLEPSPDDDLFES